MRFLSVAERELRAAARQKKTYRVRWIVATGAFALLLWLGWAFDVFARRGAGPMVFQVCSIIIFLACLFIGAAGTADCISREKREGTLGLLFLTNVLTSLRWSGIALRTARIPRLWINSCRPSWRASRATSAGAGRCFTTAMSRTATSCAGSGRMESSTKARCLQMMGCGRSLRQRRMHRLEQPSEPKPTMCFHAWGLEDFGCV